MQKVANFCDYFVICTGNSDRHVEAISQGIEEGIEKLNLKIFKKQVDQLSLWVLLDLGDIVAHVFERETRDFYRLEYLWNEAKKVKWKG